MTPQGDAPSPGPIRPHRTLTHRYGTDGERKSYVRALFDETAGEYDRTTGLLGLGSGARHRRQVLRQAGLRAGMTVLDTAAGTGQVTREAQAVVGANGTVIALDPSAGMLGEAQRQLPPGAMFIRGETERLPLAGGSVDFVSMGYAVRHVPDLVAAFAECRRVLRPGGRIVIMEIGPARGPVSRALLRFWMARAVPVLSVAFNRGPDRYARARLLMEFYWDTLDGCVAPPVIEEAMRRAGFADVRCTVVLGLFRHYTGLNAPS